MSIAHHLDALAVYGASAIRVSPRDGDPEDLLGDGGQLADAFERIGQGPLLDVLRDAEVDSVMLGDADLTVEVRRTAAGARLRVAWGARVVVDEAVEIPEAIAADSGPFFRPEPGSRLNDVVAALHQPKRTLYAVEELGGQIGWYTAGFHGRGAGDGLLRGVIPAMDPSMFGSSEFRAEHRVKWAYIAGEMAGGIASPELVLAMARADLLGFYGAGGLPHDQVEKALVRIVADLPEGRTFGANLLHNPAEPDVEERTVDLLLKHGVRRVSASAYMDLTPAVVRYRLTGIRVLPDGRLDVPNKVFAKLSRAEVAERFLRPAPDGILRELKERGGITDEQIKLARLVPLAEDVTAEGDSGGHTDRRPILVLIPLLMRLRDRICEEEGYDVRGLRPRIGAAGGLGTPAAVWAAFAMGADYVLTGSINQASLEAGTSKLVKEMLAEATFTDVTSGPAPDMFELGAQVQVLGRGTMYAQRAARLHEAWKTYGSIEEIPAAERQKIEKQIIRRNLDDVWADTVAYWRDRDPEQIKRAETDPRHKMALAFRWYLGMTSRWARVGDEDRKRDFQVWCGPAMGAFNEWAAGSELAELPTRSAVAIANAMMYGAAAHARVTTARSLGLPVPPIADGVRVING